MTSLVSEPVLGDIARRERDDAVPSARELDGLAEEVDSLGRRIRAELGEEDLSYMRRVVRISRGASVAGRVLLAGSLTPVGFSLGVAALALHKVLEAVEIGHTVLHGVYDDLDPTGALGSEGFFWEFPVDE